MKKIFFATVLLLNFQAFADCQNLTGEYVVKDNSSSCQVLQNSGQVMVSAEMPVLNIMAKPGPNYGYFLNMLIGNGMDHILIEQNGCEDINILKADESRGLLIEAGHFPYFGARSPIFVDTALDEEGITQKMLITKYTVISNGQQKVFKDLQYSSHIQLDSEANLKVTTQLLFGRNNKKYETVECTFERVAP